MKPTILLAETTTPDGARLMLHAHDGHFRISLNGEELMHSFTTSSEREMGRRIAARQSGNPEPRFLIGGLGLGFTLQAVIEQLPPRGRVEVAELMPEVVQWNRQFLRDLNGRLLDDPRVHIHTGDVADLLATPNRYDGILLDVDNGPVPMVATGNRHLYDRPGLRRIRSCLRPGGMVAFWSARPDPAFEKRLRETGFRVDPIPARAYASARRQRYMLYYAEPSRGKNPA